MIPSGNPLCWYYFSIVIYEWKIETSNVHVSSFLQTRELIIFGKWASLKEDLKLYILGEWSQPPVGLTFQGDCRFYFKNFLRTIEQNLWWHTANHSSWLIPTFFVFLISKDFSCGFTRTLAWLCEGYDYIVLIKSPRTHFRVNPHSVLRECQGTSCSKQARYLNFKLLQQVSNSQRLSSQTNTQQFRQTGLIHKRWTTEISNWGVRCRNCDAVTCHTVVHPTYQESV